MQLIACSFVLSDGQQFRCRRASEGQTPTARVLEHTNGCVRLHSLKLSPAERTMIAVLDRARSCLAAKGIRALGAPVLPPNPPGSSSADGEIVVGESAASVVFIAFYTNPARAQQLEASLMRNAHRLKDQVERHGAVTVLWVHPPSGVQASVRACAFARSHHFPTSQRHLRSWTSEAPVHPGDVCRPALAAAHTKDRSGRAPWRRPS
jgi:hypothetical protein